MATRTKTKPKPKIHAHRGGAAGVHPDNTRAAIEYGLSCGVDGVEVDLLTTKDEVIVLHHDWRIEDKPIRELSLADLRGHYAAGELLTLSEFAELMRNHDDNLTLNLELKNLKDSNDPSTQIFEPARYLPLLLKNLKPLHECKNIFLQSFDWKLMTKLIKQLTTHNLNFKTGFTTYLHGDAKGDAKIKEIKTNGGDVFSCHHHKVTARLTKHARDLGLEICAWTVNQQPDIKKMRDLGVDIITTDHPARCRALLDKVVNCR